MSSGSAAGLEGRDYFSSTDSVRTGESLAHAHSRVHREWFVRSKVVQPFVTTGALPLPLPIPAQPATLKATTVASNAITSFFI